MKKAGVPQFNYESFKTEYDSNPQLQKLVKFDPDGITVNSEAKDRLGSPEGDANANVVGDMAKRATDVGADL